MTSTIRRTAPSPPSDRSSPRSDARLRRRSSRSSKPSPASTTGRMACASRCGAAISPGRLDARPAAALQYHLRWAASLIVLVNALAPHLPHTRCSGAHRVGSWDDAGRDPAKRV